MAEGIHKKLEGAIKKVHPESETKGPDIAKDMIALAKEVEEASGIKERIEIVKEADENIAKALDEFGGVLNTLEGLNLEGKSEEEIKTMLETRKSELQALKKKMADLLVDLKEMDELVKAAEEEAEDELLEMLGDDSIEDTPESEPTPDSDDTEPTPEEPTETEAEKKEKQKKEAYEIIGRILKDLIGDSPEVRLSSSGNPLLVINDKGKSRTVRSETFRKKLKKYSKEKLLSMEAEGSANFSLVTKEDLDNRFNTIMERVRGIVTEGHERLRAATPDTPSSETTEEVSEESEPAEEPSITEEESAEPADALEPSTEPSPESEVEETVEAEDTEGEESEEESEEAPESIETPEEPTEEPTEEPPTTEEESAEPADVDAALEEVAKAAEKEKARRRKEKIAGIWVSLPDSVKQKYSSLEKFANGSAGEDEVITEEQMALVLTEWFNQAKQKLITAKKELKETFLFGKKAKEIALEDAQREFEQARAEYVGSSINRALDSRIENVDIEVEAELSRSDLVAAGKEVAKKFWKGYQWLGEKNLSNNVSAKKILSAVTFGHVDPNEKYGQFILRAMSLRTAATAGIVVGAGLVGGSVGLTMLSARAGIAAFGMGGTAYTLTKGALERRDLRKKQEETLKREDISSWNYDQVSLKMAEIEAHAVTYGKSVEETEFKDFYGDLQVRLSELLAEKMGSMAETAVESPEALEEKFKKLESYLKNQINLVDGELDIALGEELSAERKRTEIASVMGVVGAYVGGSGLLGDLLRNAAGIVGLDNSVEDMQVRIANYFGDLKNIPTVEEPGLSPTANKEIVSAPKPTEPSELPKQTTAPETKVPEGQKAEVEPSKEVEVPVESGVIHSETIHKGDGVVRPIQRILESNKEVFDKAGIDTPHEIHKWRVGQLKDLGLVWKKGFGWGYPYTVHEGAQMELFTNPAGEPELRLVGTSDQITQNRYLRFPRRPGFVAKEALNANADRITEAGNKIRELRGTKGLAHHEALHAERIPVGKGFSTTQELSPEQLAKEQQALSEIQKRFLAEQKEFAGEVAGAKAESLIAKDQELSGEFFKVAKLNAEIDAIETIDTIKPRVRASQGWIEGRVNILEPGDKAPVLQAPAAEVPEPATDTIVAPKSEVHSQPLSPEKDVSDINVEAETVEASKVIAEKAIRESTVDIVGNLTFSPGEGDKVVLSFANRVNEIISNLSEEKAKAFVNGDKSALNVKKLLIESGKLTKDEKVLLLEPVSGNFVTLEGSNTVKLIDSNGDGHIISDKRFSFSSEDGKLYASSEGYAGKREMIPSFIDGNPGLQPGEYISDNLQDLEPAEGNPDESALEQEAPEEPEQKEHNVEGEIVEKAQDEVGRFMRSLVKNQFASQSSGKIFEQRMISLVDNLDDNTIQELSNSDFTTTEGERAIKQALLESGELSVEERVLLSDVPSGRNWYTENGSHAVKVRVPGAGKDVFFTSDKFTFRAQGDNLYIVSPHDSDPSLVSVSYVRRFLFDDPERVLETAEPEDVPKSVLESK